MTWEDEASAVIAQIDKKLPADADLKTRKRALREGRPYKFVCTSWGRKTWQRAQRKYLARFGPKSDATVPVKHLSPLERMMAKAGREL